MPLSKISAEAMRPLILIDAQHGGPAGGEVGGCKLQHKDRREITLVEPTAREAGTSGHEGLRISSPRQALPSVVIGYRLIGSKEGAPPDYSHSTARRPELRLVGYTGRREAAC
jgi:hypothetical protein